MNRRAVFSILAGLLISAPSVAQVDSTFQLTADLHEISGLEWLNDTTLVAINDGGNEADLFILNTDGSVRKKVSVINAKNQDWEDLAADDEHLYIGDIGNNENVRKNLCVYKVRIADIIASNEVEAEKIAFSYADQTAFPPEANEKKYDAEALMVCAGKLWIITKMNARPWNGNAQIYQLPVSPGSYSPAHSGTVFIGENGWWFDAVTAADVYDDKVYITTYNRIIELKIAENSLEVVSNTAFGELTQKESIAIRRDGTTVVADEHQRLLGGGKLYYIQRD